MPIQRIHPRKRLITPLTHIRPNIQMQLFMPLTIMLPREALIASGPFTLERSLFVVRSQVAYRKTKKPTKK